MHVTDLSQAVCDQPLPWFEAHEVEEGVYSFVEPGHREYVRSYLVVGTESVALIDTGTGIGDMKAEVERLTDLPLQVILTHTHWDHMGGAGVQKFRDVRFWDEPTQRVRIATGYSHEELRGELREKNFGRPRPPGFDPAAFCIPPVESWRPVEVDEIISLGGRALRVLHTPGHSPGSISLWDETDGLLFVGDTFYWGPLYGYPQEFDTQTYFASAEKLAELAPKVRRVLPGHNELEWEGGPLMMGDDLIALREALRSVNARLVDRRRSAAPDANESEFTRTLRSEFGRFSIEVHDPMRM